MFKINDCKTLKMKTLIACEIFSKSFAQSANALFDGEFAQ